MPWKTIKEGCRSIIKGISLLGEACQKWEWLINRATQMSGILMAGKVGSGYLAELVKLLHQGSP